MKTAVRNILILLLIAATLAIIYWLIINYYDDKNRTDDAQVDGDIVPVLARTDGFVDSVFVEDDQVVYAGEILLQLDTTDLYLKLRQALNAYEVSKTNLKRSEIGIRSAEIEKKMATQNPMARAMVILASTVCLAGQPAMFAKRHSTFHPGW